MKKTASPASRQGTSKKDTSHNRTKVKKTQGFFTLVLPVPGGRMHEHVGSDCKKLCFLKSDLATYQKRTVLAKKCLPLGEPVLYSCLCRPGDHAPSTSVRAELPFYCLELFCLWFGQGLNSRTGSMYCRKRADRKRFPTTCCSSILFTDITQVQPLLQTAAIMSLFCSGCSLEVWDIPLIWWAVIHNMKTKTGKGEEKHRSNTSDSLCNALIYIITCQ